MTKEFNVLIYDINIDNVISYNVVPYLLEQYKKHKRPITNRESLKEWIKGECMCQFWARCEYEFIIVSWPYLQNNTLQHSKKIDVYNQILQNLDLLTDVIENQICYNKSKKAQQDLSIDRMHKMKIKEITEDYILFDNGNKITYKNGAVMANNYAAFKEIDDLARQAEFDENLDFEELRNDTGFRFGNQPYNMYFCPCYSEQNGYYDSDVSIYYNDKEVISYQEGQIYSKY